ncbi:MAG: GNAT family N-acetyltransferase [Mycobacteriales bacterium]
MTDEGQPLIRSATAQDSDAVFELSRMMAITFDVNRRAFMLSYKTILESNGGHLLVAEISGLIVGYLLGFDHPSFFANGSVAWVEELAVFPERRRSKAGSHLMADFEDRVRQRGARLVALATTRASSFYKAIGYEHRADYFRKIL